MAGLAFQLHLTHTPGETEADKARVVTLAAGGLITGSRGVVTPLRHAEDVADVEVHAQLAVEEVAAHTKVHTFVGNTHAVETQTGGAVMGVGKHLEPAPQLGPHIEAGAPAHLAVGEVFVVVAIVEHRGIQAHIEETRGAVGDVCLQALGVAAADILRHGVVDQHRTEIFRCITCVCHGADLVGVGAVIGVDADVAEAHDVLVEGGLQVVGVADKEVGVASLVAVVVEAAEGGQLRHAGRSVTAGVAEAVAGESLGLIAQVDAGHKAEEGSVHHGGTGAVQIVPCTLFPLLLATQTQFCGEATPAFLQRDIAAETCATFHAFARAQQHLFIDGTIEGVETYILCAAAKLRLRTHLKLELVLQRVGVVQRQAARRIATSIFCAAHKGVACGVVVGKGLTARATVAPCVAIEAERELAARGVKAMLQPSTCIAAPAEAVAVVHRVMVAQVAQRGVILTILEVNVAVVAPPIGIHAHPGGEVGLVGDVPVEVESGVATEIVGLGLPVAALEAAGVAIVCEKGVGAVALHAVVRVVGIDIEVEVHLLVGPHIRCPRRHAGRSPCPHTHTQQLVAGHLLVGDDIDDTACGGVACRGVGDDLDALDGVGGQLLDVLFQRLLVHVRRAVVDPNLHAAHTPQGDVAFGVHLHARRILQGVAGGTRLYGGILLGVVHVLLAVHHIEGLLSHNLHLSERGATF